MRLVVDGETGVVSSELYEGDRIVRAKSIEYYKALRRGGRRFVKMDISEGEALMPELSPNERSMIFLLQYYVSYESCLIRYSNGKDISFSNLVELSGWSRQMVSNVLNGLIDKNIIYKGKNGRNVQYFLNPWIGVKGTAINPTLYEMFKHYKVRSRGNITWEELKKLSDDDSREKC